MSVLCHQPAHQQLKALLSFELSAVELLQCYEQQIQQYNETLNALITLDLEQAYLQARQADNHLARTKKALGPLHGLPLAVKDIFHVQGMRTTFGNLNFAHHISDHDSELVAREKAAGAVIIGKSNTPDCASGGITTNAIFGLTRNPWNLTKTTSGSGGGGAAAIAAGLVSIADGSDVGGSTRTPACWSNCLGFRPSSGHITAAPGSIADGSISTPGVFTRSVEDIVLFMQATTGTHEHSAIPPAPVGAAFTQEDLRQNTKHLRIGWINNFADACMQDDIAQLFERAKHSYQQLGYQVHDIDLGLGDAFRLLYRDINAYAYVKGLPEVVLQQHLQGETIKPSIATNIEHYLNMTALQRLRMWQAVDELKVKIQRIMQEYPIIVLPAHFESAFDVNDTDAEQACDWVSYYLAPMLGLPSLSLPAGFTKDGMPWSLLLHGRAGQDMEVLQLAAAYEQVTHFATTCQPALVKLQV